VRGAGEGRIEVFSIITREDKFDELLVQLGVNKRTIKNALKSHFTSFFNF
jgi:hypothetical protein